MLGTSTQVMILQDKKSRLVAKKQLSCHQLHPKDEEGSLAQSKLFRSNAHFVIMSMGQFVLRLLTNAKSTLRCTKKRNS